MTMMHELTVFKNLWACSVSIFCSPKLKIEEHRCERTKPLEWTPYPSFDPIHIKYEIMLQSCHFLKAINSVEDASKGWFFFFFYDFLELDKLDEGFLVAVLSPSLW